MMETTGALRAVLRRLSVFAPTSVWAFVLVVGLLNIGLAVVASGRVGRLSLVLLAAIVFGGVLFYLFRLDRVVGSLRRQEGALTARNDQATSLVRNLLTIERSEDVLIPGKNFAEDLDLTLWVGSSAAQDRVVEIRRTWPTLPVGHRALTLISPYVCADNENVVLAPQLHVLDDTVEASWLPLEPDGRGVAVFSPPAYRESLQWNISYDVPTGLWNPLRSVGVDVFRYDVRSFPIKDFAVHFIFDQRANIVFVQERNRRGVAEEPRRNPEGNWVVDWSAGDSAVAAKYEWDVRVDWHTQMK